MATVRYREIEAAPDAGVRNSQPEGIGRVAVVGDLVGWNNLGRNVVFADAGLRPGAIFGTTVFPDDDEASQYDLDVHAILDVPECGMVVVLNHFGLARGFRRSDLVGQPDGSLIAPSAAWSFVADVERTVAAAGRLVGSAPRSGGAIGLLVSDLIDGSAGQGGLPTTVGATSFGEVTALSAVPSPSSGSDSLVAVGGDGHVALVPLRGGQVGRARWEKTLGFRVASLVQGGGTLWAAGPEGGTHIDDYDWERLSGGGFAVFDLTDGKTVMSGPLPDDVAWGTGGVAVAPLGSLLVAAGRTGRLHVLDPGTGVGLTSTASLAETSLGIAHLAVVGRQVLCGFNRGGYRLHCFTVDTGAAADP
jgi:hypothetical protein